MQRRHLDAAPYENLAIMLGRPDPTDPAETLERIAAGGNAGYCFHHNGAFEVVLRALGFAVERRSGHVWGRAVPELNHLVLLVTIDGRRWWPDLGLGDALRDPVEVVPGEIRQGPFRYEIAEAGAGAWTFRHDPAAGSFPGLDVRASRPADAEVAAAHRVLSTPPDGRFTGCWWRCAATTRAPRCCAASSSGGRETGRSAGTWRPTTSGGRRLNRLASASPARARPSCGRCTPACWPSHAQRAAAPQA